MVPKLCTLVHVHLQVYPARFCGRRPAHLSRSHSTASSVNVPRCALPELAPLLDPARQNHPRPGRTPPPLQGLLDLVVRSGCRLAPLPLLLPLVNSLQLQPFRRRIWLGKKQLHAWLAARRQKRAACTPSGLHQCPVHEVLSTGKAMQVVICISCTGAVTTVQPAEGWDGDTLVQRDRRLRWPMRCRDLCNVVLTGGRLEIVANHNDLPHTHSHHIWLQVHASTGWRCKCKLLQRS